MALTVWLLQTGEPLHIDAGNPRPMRAMNLANALVAAGHNVVLWSTEFYHQEKRHRSCGERINISAQLQIRLIPSPGYVRNIGLGRLWDHAVLARNLGQRLDKETQLPDVAFIGYPPIEAAAVMARWLRLRGIPSMLDIKDQWPTLFVDALPKFARPLGRVAFAPYFHLARRTMRDATGLSSMTESFLAWAIDFQGRQRSDMDRVVPLTTPSDQVCSIELEAARQWWDDKGIAADGRLRVFFVGSHAPTFDIEPINQAARHFASHATGCEFVICGDGGSSAGWRSLMSTLPNVHFPGWVDRAQIEALAERSHAALTPYHNIDNFTKNLPNKVIDALSLGLPILNPLQGEVAALISNHGVGLRYGTDSGKSLVQCIEVLMDNPRLRRQMSGNALNLYKEQFSFERVYGGLVKHLELLSLKKRQDA
jgi:glycosyltransferase involved in cell wall biosynthesis